MTLTISELADTLGVRSDTIRFYEKTGLITSSGRTQGGYRLYEDETCERVRFIKDCQRFGLRLREIAELLAIIDEGTCPCGHTAEVVAQRISETEDELRRLEELRGKLLRLRQEVSDCRNDSVDLMRTQLVGSQKGGDPE